MKFRVIRVLEFCTNKKRLIAKMKFSFRKDFVDELFFVSQSEAIVHFKGCHILLHSYSIEAFKS